VSVHGVRFHLELIPLLCRLPDMLAQILEPLTVQRRLPGSAQKLVDRREAGRSHGFLDFALHGLHLCAHTFQAGRHGLEGSAQLHGRLLLSG
jgi:hypothetical protein